MHQKPELHTENGFTIGIYLPPEVPREIVERIFDRATEMVYGERAKDQKNWDPAIVGHPGDVLQYDTEGHDCCPPHVYFSTSCFHGDHNYCQSETGLIGNKTPSACKFCAAPCVCKCHGTVVIVDA